VDTPTTRRADCHERGAERGNVRKSRHQMTTWFSRASFGPWIAAKQFLLLQSLLRVAVAAGAVTM